ncbi:unnamed protein product, partial [Rotaria socialis]
MYLTTGYGGATTSCTSNAFVFCTFTG